MGTRTTVGVLVASVMLPAEIRPELPEFEPLFAPTVEVVVVTGAVVVVVVTGAVVVVVTLAAGAWMN